MARKEMKLTMRLAKIFTRMVYIVVAAFAAGAGAWAGSQASLPHPHDNASRGQRVDVVARLGILCEDHILARVRPLAGYAPIGSIELNGDSLAALGEQTSAMRANGAISGGGFADIFDRDGRLVQRYVAIQHSDGSWQLAQYLRRPAASESSHEKHSSGPAD
ncbi:MAG: hypothetical protein JOZ29_09695 [Deltaproteobacteria bacterium]|nr:hypothetical protein [Deltaproteobacteria bacterium]